MKKPFFARHSLLVLVIVFFLVPFALRGARMAVQRMKNDVKDWLPSDFAETTELDWFREHFLGEQFVVVSWEGCSGRADDEAFKTFVDKFYPEVPPSIRVARDAAADPAKLVDAASRESADNVLAMAKVWPVEVRRRDFTDSQWNMYVRQLKPGDLPPEEESLGNQLGLSYDASRDYYNWGGLKEKWLLGDADTWYYVTPDGDLYQWLGGSSMLQPLFTAVRRAMGNHAPRGEYVGSLGAVDGPWYYADPRRLQARYFKSLTTGPGVLHELTREGAPLQGDPTEAMRRLTGSLFGPDGEQTCLVVTLTEAAKRDLRRVIGRGILGKPRGRLIDMAVEAGIHPTPKPSMIPPAFAFMFPKPPAEVPPVIKLGGPSVDNVAIDEEGQITLVRLVGLSVFVGVALSWIGFRSFNITIMVFFVGGVSAVTGLSFVFWSGMSVDAVLMSMPSLVYVLGLSGAVHIVNYYRESVDEVGLRAAAGRAVRLGWKPCTLAALTTALGLISLYSSNILPIRKFGLFSALGVMATLILLFTYLPAALQTWPPRRFRSRDAARELTRSEQRIANFWQIVGGFIVKRYAAVATVCMILMIVVGYGLTNIRTDVQLLKMFDADATIIRDYQWLEQHLCRLVPMEIVVKVRPERIGDEASADLASEPSLDERLSLSFLERMEVTSYLQEVVDHQFGEHGEQIVGQAMSAAVFGPVLPTSGGGVLKVAERGGFSRQLAAHRDDFLKTDYLRIDKQDQSELWRISLRLGALNDIDYGEFVKEFKQSLEPVFAAYRYRDEILTQLDQQASGAGIRNASVYLIGAPFGQSRSAAEPTVAEGSGGDELTNSERHSVVFAKILGRLLRNAGLDIRDWHDPRFAIPADWNQVLSRQDCVVLIGDQNSYDVDSIREHARLLVDARDHVYVPGTPTAHDRGEAVSAVYTGLVPVVYKAQRTLLDSLVVSTFGAFAMIAIVMVFVVRSVPAGLLSMLPNVFPVLLIFGTMGWKNIAVDIGSMMTASVAMGVAVDDTIHFLTWFRRGLDRGLQRTKAILLAYEKVGLAMTQTTAIGGLGLSIFAFSTFTPTQRFGTLMLTLLITALVGDLIFLPALLASPLGRVFDRRSRPDKTPAPPVPHTSLPTESESTIRPPYTRHDAHVKRG